MEVLKHFIHTQYVIVMQSGVVCCLIHYLTTSLRLSNGTNFPKFCPHLHGINCVRVNTRTYQQHIKVLKHFIYIHYEFGMQSEVVYSPKQDELLSFWLILVLNFPIFAPHLHGINCVRVHSRAYQQHIKVLKHSLHIHPI